MNQLVAKIHIWYGMKKYTKIDIVLWNLANQMFKIFNREQYFFQIWSFAFVFRTRFVIKNVRHVCFRTHSAKVSFSRIRSCVPFWFWLYHFISLPTYKISIWKRWYLSSTSSKDLTILYQCIVVAIKAGIICLYMWCRIWNIRWYVDRCAKIY